MSSRGFRFFITKPEFYALLNQMIKEMDIHPIYCLYDRICKKDVVHAMECPVVGNNVEQIGIPYMFLSESKPDIAALNASRWVAGFYGWIAIDLPEKIDNKLKIISLSIKTDWYDDEFFENPQGLVFYNRVARTIQKELSKGVLLYDDEGVFLRSLPGIYYSKGAFEFSKKGGVLCQNFQDSLRYICKSQNE